MDFENPEETAKCQSLINSIDIPIVYVDRISDNLSNYSVIVNQEMIGYLATKYLLDIGHTQIGCASGSINLKVNSSRYKGYQTALSERGIPANHNLLFCDSLSIECGQKALPYLLG